MVQIPDKPALFSEILRVLKPGGRFIASDWLRGGSGAYSPEMMEYFRLEGIAYNMVTLEASAAALRQRALRRRDRDRQRRYLGAGAARARIHGGSCDNRQPHRHAACAALHRQLAPVGARSRARRAASGAPQGGQTGIASIHGCRSAPSAAIRTAGDFSGRVPIPRKGRIPGRARRGAPHRFAPARARCSRSQPTGMRRARCSRRSSARRRPERAHARAVSAAVPTPREPPAKRDARSAVHSSSVTPFRRAPRGFV